MSESTSASATWPARIIHVNEDGWVLINRGVAQGVAPGFRLLVVGTNARELRDLFPSAEGGTALRIRRTYELLEVVYAEEACAVAIAARTPAARRPTCYRGPTGELLVWVPLRPDYTYPPPGGGEDDEDDEPEDAVEADATNDTDDTGDEADDAENGAPVDAPPQEGEQQDETWEEALPLNGLSVGDLVVPAIPATPGSASATPYEDGRAYEQVKPEQG